MIFSPGGKELRCKGIGKLKCVEINLTPGGWVLGKRRERSGMG